MKIYYSLLGYRRISFDMSHSADVLNLCMKYGYPYREMKVDEDRISFICTAFSASRIAYRAKEIGIEADLGKLEGLLSFLLSVFSHPGLVLGFFISCFIIVISGEYVWDIRVIGNERFTEEDVETALEACGFFVGSSLKNFNPDKTELECLIANPELAWISVNMRGTVAYVEVREKLAIEPQLQEKKSANIVASHSGRIIEIIAYNGIPTVKAGDEVRVGELLISGAYGDKTPGLRVTRASGYALARTVRTFSVDFPYDYTEKVYSDEKKSEFFMVFFKKSIKVFGNSGNFGVSCDIIEEEKNITLFGERLPVSFLVKSNLPYVLKSAKYTVEEARSRAKEQLEIMIKESLPDAEILFRNDSFTVGENSVRIECEIVCIENIALVQEFETKYN